MELGQAFHERKSEAESAVSTVGSDVSLNVGFKHSGQQLFIHPVTVVAHHDAYMASEDLGVHANFAAGRRVFGGVSQQIRKHLRQPVRISTDPDWRDR